MPTKQRRFLANFINIYISKRRRSTVKFFERNGFFSAVTCDIIILILALTFSLIVRKERRGCASEIFCGVTGGKIG
jgi:hypothetical protein